MEEALVEEEEEMPLGGAVDLVVLAPSLSTSECEAFLAARRRRTTFQGTTTTTTESSPIPVIVLCAPTNEAPSLLEEEGQAVRSVPWPTSRERLMREIKDVVHGMYLPPGYYLDPGREKSLTRAQGAWSFGLRSSGAHYTGWRLGLDASDWRSLVALAKPVRGEADSGVGPLPPRSVVPRTRKKGPGRTEHLGEGLAPGPRVGTTRGGS
jgi:hypothetical protein